MSFNDRESCRRLFCRVANYTMNVYSSLEEVSRVRERRLKCAVEALMKLVMSKGPLRQLHACMNDTMTKEAFADGTIW